MKFTKLIAASFAALMIFSCSKEVMDVDNGKALNPGDARIMWSLNNGSTTYATAAQEREIKSLQWALYDFEGKKVDATNVDAPSLTSVDIRVSASVVEHYINLTKPLVGLHILLNSDKPMPATLAEYQALVVDQSLNSGDVVTTGIVAKFSLNITLSYDNSQNISAYRMTRGAARFGVIAGGEAGRADIVGATLKLNGLSTGVKPYSNTGFGSMGSSELYEIKETAPVDQFGGAEAAFYAYPTNSGATLDVMFGGETKTIQVGKIEPNKNYIVTIIPNVKAGKKVIGSITLAEFVDGSSDEYGVRFGVGKDLEQFVDGLVSPSADIKFEKGGLIRFANNTTDVFEYALADLFKDEDFTGVKVLGIVDGVYTYATSNDQISSDRLLKATATDDGKLKIERNFNSHKAKKYEVKVACSNSKEYIVKFIINGAGQPENLFVNLNGVEIMTVGVNATAATTPTYYATLIANIEKKEGATFAEQTKAYVDGLNGANTNAFNGSVANLTDMLLEDLYKMCPEGSEAPTMDQLLKAFFNSTSAELPAVFTQATGANNKIQYVPGVPQYGVTLFDVDGTSKKYWSVASSNGKMLYLTSSVNIASSSTVDAGGIPTSKRLVFYGPLDDVQHRAANNGSTLRCVKKTKF